MIELICSVKMKWKWKGTQAIKPLDPLEEAIVINFSPTVTDGRGRQ
jgi:hypothetical protein